MARLNLDKMSYAELSELRSNVERMMLEKQSSERSALRQKMAEMAEAAGMSLDALLGRGRKGGLPHIAAPGIRLESGRCWPASGLAGAQRRAEQTLAARSSRVPAGDSRARNAV